VSGCHLLLYQGTHNVVILKTIYTSSCTGIDVHDGTIISNDPKTHYSERQKTGSKLIRTRHSRMVKGSPFDFLILVKYTVPASVR
jgi:hypothetical protein